MLWFYLAVTIGTLIGLCFYRLSGTSEGNGCHIICDVVLAFY